VVPERLVQEGETSTHQVHAFVLVCVGVLTFFFFFLPNLFLFFAHFVGIKPELPKSLAEYAVEDDDDKPEIRKRK
jgi:Sec-independent protein secretion pathway component TatC